VSDVKNNLQGQIADGKFPLLRLLGESDHSLVFLTERKQEPQKAVIKLIPANGVDAGKQIAQWEVTAKLSHPHLTALYETGRCQIGAQSYLYAVMEYADENLYQILPERALTPAEAREMLPSVVDGLRYLHSQGLAHGHIKPANVMACGEQLKISSDGVTKTGAMKTPRARSLYDPPEGSSTGFSPAWDVWSLGVTIVEALTQHPPVLEGTAEGQNLLPQSLPSPFAEIVRNCLRPRPEQRWPLDDVAASLDQAASSKLVPAEIQEQSAFAKPGRLIALSAVTIIVLAFFVVKLWHGRSQATEASAEATPVVVANPSTAKPDASVEAAPVAEIPQKAATPVTTAPPAPVKKVAEPQPAARSPSGVQQVLPNVPRSASRTIQGTIKVKVKVTTDDSGNVSSANLVLPGSSQYFARLALEASRKWRFPTAERAEGPWMITFEFRRSGTRASASAK
jgi:eukaryotic-like serine/threonine-protein kinase